MLALAVALFAPQSPTELPDPLTTSLRVLLTPAEAEATGGPRWSPKGAKVVLSAQSPASGLRGSFALGPTASAPITVQLTHDRDGEHFDQLWIDLDRNGERDAAELLTCTPKETRGKWWSSFNATIPLPVPGDDGGAVATTRPYPVAMWFVVDPSQPAGEPDAEPVLRWSRRGWHSGQTEVGGKAAFVLITEMEMDGVFDQRDSWAIARSAVEAGNARSAAIEQHCWLDGKAWRPTAVDPHGRWIEIAPFDPGLSEAEELAKADTTRPDREAPRAATPLAWSHDHDAALATAKREQKRVLLDFETTWCGPCKAMDQMVYPAQAVVDACADVVPVKIDGDEHKALVKRYEVAAYPTVLLLDADGKVLRRAVGYQSVAAMVRLLAK